MDIKGWNIPRLSEASGVSTNTISAYKRGTREPQLSIALALAKALDISMDKLCGLNSSNGEQLTSGEKEILKLYRKLTDNRQRQMVRQLLLSYQEGK